MESSLDLRDESSERGRSESCFTGRAFRSSLLLGSSAGMAAGTETDAGDGDGDGDGDGAATAAAGAALDGGALSEATYSSAGGPHSSAGSVG